jgi:hypothetical protein
MRSGLVFCFLFLAWMSVGALAETDSHDTPLVSTYIVRTGEQLQAPHVLTYKLVEYELQRGRWILPDLGAYDAGRAQSKLLFLAAGADLHRGKKTFLTQEIYFVQAAGPGSHGARSLWVWPVLDLNFTPRLKAEAVAYPTIPLNRAAQAGFDVDRAKLEYAVRRNFTLGGGYGSSKCEGSAWQNKPFLTTTIFSRAGSVEFWLQQMPGGGQVQARYTLVHAGR